MPGHSNPSGNAFDGVIIPTTAPADSSFRTNYLPYDVFISHHGSDVKHTIAHDIYKILDATGLRVFLDEEHLKLGDFFPITLQEAMGSASMHIAILSENYASSPWCMAELAYMMQTGIRFIPIFYNVEPSTVRWAIKGNGLYADAFDKYEMQGRYSSEQLESWKSALHKASLYTGEIIKNQCNEEQVMKNVVNRVVKALKEDRLEVAKYPVGLDDVVRDFENTLKSAGPTQIVGIYGLGGVGKTTLEKEFYNRKRSTFGRSSFIFDVGEAARQGRLHEVQKKLLDDLDLKGKYVDFDNVKEGKKILESRLRSVPMLVVLDDVDDPDQVNALLPARESLAQGAVIIVTARHLGVLKVSGIPTTYEMRTLNEGHAHLLFCWHAFKQPSPLLGFEDLTEMFINACHGLPLLLTVLGSLLYGKSSKDYWHFQLDKISKIRTEDIKSKLKTSYDALEYEEKGLFLDLACFFVGEKRTLARDVMDGFARNGLNFWQRLADKCLVEVDNRDRIIMHAYLRDLGRKIANEQSSHRLWSPQRTLHIQPQQEAVGIRAMSDAFSGNCYPHQGKIIERTHVPLSRELKILSGNGNFFTAEWSESLSGLVWLRWNRIKGKKLPSWLSLKKLRILELVDPCELEDLLECDNAPLQLRELNIRGAHKLKKIERIESLTCLKKLVIDNLSNLYRLPNFSRLKSLRVVQLRNCSKLHIESLEYLRSLEDLRIRDCANLDRLPNLADLISLKKFILIRCGILENVEGLQSLRSLEILNINSCPELTALPSLAKLTMLKEIKLENCYKLEKIEGLERVSSLETFVINDCPKLRLCMVSRF